MQTSYGSRKADTGSAGRAPVLDQHVRNTLIEAFANGASKKVACGAANISPDTLSRWQRAVKNRQELSPYSYDELRTLFRDIDEARSRFARRMLNSISRAAEVDGDWRAAAWALERLYPDEYGKTLEIVDTQGHSVRTFELPDNGDYSGILNAINEADQVEDEDMK